MENTVIRRFLLRRILAYYTLENKSSNTCKFWPDELDESPIENKHEGRY